MPTRQLIIFVALSLLTAAAVVIAVTTYQRSRQHVLVDAPGVHIETGKDAGKTSIDAPLTHVEKDAGGTHIEAPGDKVDVPKSSSD